MSGSGEKKNKKILMVEDESALKEWFEVTFKSIGRTIVWASSIDEAKKFLADPNEEWELVVSDFNFQDSENGLDVWAMARKQHPRTPFLLISGVPDQLFQDLLDSGVQCPPFLLKPFTAHEFRLILRDLLAIRSEKAAA